jgi:inhibitor of KinA
VPALTWTSDRTLRIAIGTDAGESTYQRVRAVHAALHASPPLPACINITPTYAAVTLAFDLRRLLRDAGGHAGIETLVADRVAIAAQHPAPPPRLVEIPVCYEDPGCGPDLHDLAALRNLTAADVIRLHSGAIYTVRFLGFSPGFAYLAGLPPALHTPRLPTPRVSVPAGSVGIAGEQTGIYPRSTPGGWRLIGRTSLPMFDASRAEPATLRIGDRVRFIAVPRP